MPKPLRKTLKIGDHVVHEHKGRIYFGIIREFTGESRAKVEWVSGSNGSPFPVCVEDLTLDTEGVVL